MALSLTAVSAQFSVRSQHFDESGTVSVLYKLLGHECSVSTVCIQSQGNVELRTDEMSRSRLALG